MRHACVHAGADCRGVVFTGSAAGGLAYFGNFNGSLYAVNIKTGQLVWKFQTESSKKDALQFPNPDGTRKDNAAVPGFVDFQDMYIFWYKNFSLGATVSSPVVGQGEIYFGSTDGNLYVLQ